MPSRFRHSKSTLCSYAFLYILLPLILTAPSALAREHIKLQTLSRNDGSVRIKVRIVAASLKARFPQSILLSRSSDPLTIHVVRKIKLRKKQRVLFDGPLDAGTYFYRGRIAGHGHRVWSKIYSITTSTNQDDGNTSPTDPTPPAPQVPTVPVPRFPPLPAGLSVCKNSVEDTIVSRVNEYRLAAGLSPVGTHPLLSYAARLHSARMAENRQMTHDGWFDEIWNTAGYRGSYIGQNIAAYFVDPITLVDAWMNSPGHRENILKPEYKDIGVSCINDVNGNKWWTQDFGG